MPDEHDVEIDITKHIPPIVVKIDKRKVGSRLVTQPTPPEHPRFGDIWVDNSQTPSVIKTYDGTNWVTLVPPPLVVTSGIAPVQPVPADDTTPIIIDSGIVVVGTPGFIRGHFVFTAQFDPVSTTTNHAFTIMPAIWDSQDTEYDGKEAFVNAPGAGPVTFVWTDNDNIEMPPETYTVGMYVYPTGGTPAVTWNVTCSFLVIVSAD
jgi:hypothetical protein